MDSNFLYPHQLHKMRRKKKCRRFKMSRLQECDTIKVFSKRCHSFCFGDVMRLLFLSGPENFRGAIKRKDVKQKTKKKKERKSMRMFKSDVVVKTLWFISEKRSETETASACLVNVG